MKGHWIKYSDEELSWVESRKNQPRHLLHSDFQRVFGRHDVSFENFKALCTRKGWKTGRTGCFEPGIVPHNKGKPMPFSPQGAAACARTQFKKGGRTGRAAQLYKPIGTERLTHDGYVERKIHDGEPKNTRWQLLHLIQWEERNGRLPDGHALKCLDGNRANTDPSNWEAIPRALLPRMNGRHGRNYETAPDKLKPTILAIAKLEHAVRVRRSGKPIDGDKNPETASR